MPLKITKYNQHEVREYYDYTLPPGTKLSDDFTYADSLRAKLDVYSNDDEDRILRVHGIDNKPAPFLYGCDGDGKNCSCGAFPDAKGNVYYGGVSMNTDNSYSLNPSGNNNCNNNKPISNNREYQWRSATYKRDHKYLLAKGASLQGDLSGSVMSSNKNKSKFSSCYSCGGGVYSCGRKC